MWEKKERKNRSEDQSDDLTGCIYSDESPKFCSVSETGKTIHSYERVSSNMSPGVAVNKFCTEFEL